MDVVVAGGHGQIALRLLRLLAERGDRARGLIRNPDHAGDLEAAGAEPVICDMEAEDDLGPWVEGAVRRGVRGRRRPGQRRGAQEDRGPRSRPQADCGGQDLGGHALLMISALNADHPERASEAMRPYYEAKGAADDAVRASALDYTIARPGRLTDDPGSGRIRAGTDIGSGSVSRDDVAATLAAVLVADNTIGVTFDLLEGDTPIEEAVAGLAR